MFEKSQLLVCLIWRLTYLANLKEQFLRIGPYFYDTTLALRAEPWARTGGHKLQRKWPPSSWWMWPFSKVNVMTHLLSLFLSLLDIFLGLEWTRTIYLNVLTRTKYLKVRHLQLLYNIFDLIRKIKHKGKNKENFNKAIL